MSYNSYLSLLAQNNNVSVEEAKQLPGLAFPVANRTTGQTVIKNIEKILNKPIRGNKLLDIGCGHGGFTVEASLAGAESHGIEYDLSCYKYAVENNRDEGYANLVQLDATSYEFQKLYPKGYFDIVVAFTVFEHVYDIQALLINIQHCLRKGGLLYFYVPNGWALSYVLSEGHYEIFGVSILDPECWQFIPNTPERHGIYYRRWELYNILMQHYLGQPTRRNFHDQSGEDKDKLNQHVSEQLAHIDQRFKSGHYDETAKSLLRNALSKYYTEVNHALSIMPVKEFHWNFTNKFWEGYIINSGETI